MMPNLRIVVSDKCNYQCVFCSRDFNKAVNLNMPPDFLEECIRIFAKLGGKKVTFTGGEPLIYPQLMEILNLTKSLGLINSITTNGSMLSFQSKEFYNLVDALNISIPSFVPQEYISLTHGISLEDIKHNAVYASSMGLKVKINCVYNQGRELMIDDMIEYFSQHGIIIKIMNDMLADEEYYLSFLDYASRFEHDSRVEIECELNPGYEICIECNIPRKFSCPSCRSVWVYPNGKITLCPFDGTKSYIKAEYQEIHQHIKELINYVG